MHSRSHILATLALLPCLILAGCGSRTAQSPEAGELDRYLQENPDAATLAGDEEPEGFDGPEADGPTEFPGQDEQ